MQTYFITATDTDAGKTYVTSQLLKAARLQGLKSLALKPIASGITKNQLSDIDFILAAMQQELSIKDINFYSFEQAIAPHIAAKEQGIELDLDKIISTFIKPKIALYKSHDLLLIEGVGGWLVPLNKMMNQANLVKQLDIPVIVVVRIKTGCINHALLSFEAIKSRGVKIAAWIANDVEENNSIKRKVAKENIQSIEDFSGIPCLAELPMQQITSESLYTELASNAPSNNVYHNILRELL